MAKKTLDLLSVVVCWIVSIIIIIGIIMSRLIMPMIGWLLKVQKLISLMQRSWAWAWAWGSSTDDDDEWWWWSWVLGVEEISSKLSVEKSSVAIKKASSDFGKLVHSIPGGVFHPSSEEDIVTLVKFAYNNNNNNNNCTSFPALKLAARGRGHSCRGQALVDRHGIVIDMSSLSSSSSLRIRVVSTNTTSSSSNPNNNNNNNNYVEVGGEQLWIDVLNATLDKGLAPVSWTDYLYLTVGGTLSNAGISGQSFRYGPQISTVLQLHVLTGKGELITCAKDMNPELFYAVLGGLGQFGIITRAKIKLEPAPKRVKWVRMVYKDFARFTRDEEQLISEYGNYQERGINKEDGVDYVEGSVIMLQQGDPNNWRSSFFTTNDQAKITSLNVVPADGLLYCLEVAKYYYHDHPSTTTFDEKLERQLKYIPGYKFTKEVTLVEFLNRVREGELHLQSKGLWEVPHPWLNIFIPRSQILDFFPVITHIIANHDTYHFAGPLLIYPLNRNKWDKRMSAITPEEEEVFYTLGLLHSGSGSGSDDWKALEVKNEAILKYCVEHDIKIKQYLPHYTAKQDWIAHFGSHWPLFHHRKTLFDPKFLLSPGHNIFN